jgi:DNA-binding transcriptional LysR family regulator
MTISIAVEATDKLGKLLRLIFSSDRPGEFVAAVHATKRLLATNGLDGHWVADRITAVPHAADRADRRDDDVDGEHEDRSAIWFCWHRKHRLSPKECAFIENIVTWSRPLSAKQRKWLGDIIDKLEAS